MRCSREPRRIRSAPADKKMRWPASTTAIRMARSSSTVLLSSTLGLRRTAAFGQIEQVVSSADCRSAVFDCGGSIPSLPTSISSNDGPNGSSSCFQPIEQALAACEAIGDRHRSAALHNNLADLLRAQGRKDDAMRHLKRAVRLFSEIGEAGTNEPEVWKLIGWTPQRS